MLTRSVDVPDQRHRAPGAKGRHGETIRACGHHCGTPYAASLTFQSRCRPLVLPRSLTMDEGDPSVPTRSVDVPDERHRAPGAKGRHGETIRAS